MNDIIHNNPDYLIPHLEWEFSSFPLDLRQISFEKDDWGFESDTTISIWRDNTQRLIGKICGKNNQPNNFKHNYFIGKGNIVKGQNIKGIDENGNNVELNNCLWTEIKCNSKNVGKIEGTIVFDKLKFSANIEQKTKTTRFDWFSCTDIPAHFSERTLRNTKLKSPKIRIGIDEFDDKTENFIGGACAKDYAEVNLHQISFLISEIPEIVIIGSKMKGICLEFRNYTGSIDNELINGIQEFVSFLFGNELYYWGNSIVNDNKLLEANLLSLSEIIAVNVMPPIKFNRKYQWGDLSHLLNKYLPEYLLKRKKLALNTAISRFQMAKTLPLGSNLPILSSAVEIIAGAYMELSNTITTEYLSEKEYNNLIKDEILQIKEKLMNIEGGEKIISKIENAFRKGVNEKMNSFLQSIGIEIGKLEKDAINLRNKMAHSSRDYSIEEKIHDDIVLSRAYEVLFNRIVLKLLNYNDYYIDYTIQNCPSKPIQKCAGSQEPIN